MNWSCRLNAMIWMLNLGTEARRAELSLLGRGVLPFLGPSPPLSMPFFPSNNKHPSPEPFLGSPTASVFSVPNTIHTNLSSTPLVYGSHPCLMSNLALFPPPFTAYTQKRERRRLKKKSRPLREGRIELVDKPAGRHLFSDGEGPAKNARSLTPSDVPSLPTPPCPQANTTVTYPPFGLDNAFCAGDDGFGSYDDHACCTYER